MIAYIIGAIIAILISAYIVYVYNQPGDVLHETRPGWDRGSKFAEIPGTYATPLACQQAAIASSTPYIAWGWRNDKHPSPAYRNTCFGYTSLGKAPYVPTDPSVHISGCVKPYSISTGCAK